MARAAALAVALSLTACGGGAPDPPDPQGAPGLAPPLVLLLEVDTLRADALEPYGGPGLEGATPAVAALADEGRVLTGAYASAPWTLPSVATLLTGKWPWEHGATRLLGRLGDGHTTLAEAFGAAGFRTGGVMTNFVATADYGFAQGFELWDDDLATGHEGSTAAAAVTKLLAQYDELAAGGEPVFLYTLWFEPHWRYEHDPTAGPAPPVAAVESLNDLRESLAAGGLTDQDLADLRALYAVEVARIDAALAALRAGLEQRGVWDEALVVLTSDHGELLGERGWIGHTVDLSDTLTRVPLLVRGPGIEPGTSAAPVSQVDLGATLLELAGVDERPGAFGRAPTFADVARGISDAPPREHLYLHVDFEPRLVNATSDRKRSLRWGVVEAATGRKWVVDHLAEGGPAGHLYDTGAFPAVEPELDGEPGDLAHLLGLVPEPLDGRRGEEAVE